MPPYRMSPFLIHRRFLALVPQLRRASHRRNNAYLSQLSRATAGGVADTIEAYPVRNVSGWNSALTVSSEDASDQNRPPRSPSYDTSHTTASVVNSGKHHHHGGTDDPKASTTDNFNYRKQPSLGERKWPHLRQSSNETERTTGLTASFVGGKRDNNRDSARSLTGESCQDKTPPEL